MPLYKVVDTAFHNYNGNGREMIVSLKRTYMSGGYYSVTLTVSVSHVNTRRRPNVVLMLARRLRRQPNIKATFGQCLVFAGEEVPERDTSPSLYAILMLVHRLRRWPNIKPTYVKRLLFAR